MSQADLNPYRSSEVLAELTPPIESEPIRPSFAVFQIAAGASFVVFATVWGVIAFIGLGSELSMARVLLGFPLWVVTSIGIGAFASLVPFLKQFRKSPFQAGHYIAFFSGLFALLFLVDESFEILYGALRLGPKPIHISFSRIPLLVSIVPIAGLLNSRLPWRWRLTFMLVAVTLLSPFLRLLPLRFLQDTDLFAALAAMLALALCLVAEFILWGKLKSRHDWLHRLGVLTPVIFVSLLALMSMFQMIVPETF